MGPSQVILLLALTLFFTLLNAPGLYLGFMVARKNKVKFYQSPDFYLLAMLGPIAVGVFHYLIAYSDIDLFDHTIFNVLRLASLPFTPVIFYLIRFNNEIKPIKINWRTDWFEWSFLALFTYVFFLMLSEWSFL